MEITWREERHEEFESVVDRIRKASFEPTPIAAAAMCP
jgi:hypothetical protein